MDHVLYCDAIKGDFDMVLLLQAANFSELHDMVDNKIKKLEGIKDICFLPVESPLLSESVNGIIGTVDKALGRNKGNPEAANNPNFWKSASSYVFLEIEKEKMENIYPTLYLNDQVVSCDCAKGKYDIVLLMQGTSFAEIDRNIQKQDQAPGWRPENQGISDHQTVRDVSKAATEYRRGKVHPFPFCINTGLHPIFSRNHF